MRNDIESKRKRETGRDKHASRKTRRNYYRKKMNTIRALSESLLRKVTDISTNPKS